jgi:hypothetical protein
MPGNRKAFEAVVIKNIEAMLPGGGNAKLYTDLFATMDDEAFDKFVTDLETEKQHLCIIAPNFNKVSLSVERNLDLAEKLGHNFFQRVWIPSKNGLPSYLTPVPYLVVDLPLRRQAQVLEKKISIPEDNNSVDDFTGQPTGKSKGSKVSYPETQVLASLGLTRSLTEFLKYRGGDEKGFNAMNTMISRTGGVSMDAIAPYSGRVKATTTLETFLTAMMLENTL